jgi:hypothetical protein
VLHVGVEGGAGRVTCLAKLSLALVLGVTLPAAADEGRFVKMCFGNLFLILFKNGFGYHFLGLN